MHMQTIRGSAPLELIDDEIQLNKTVVEYEGATDFKGSKALHNTILDIDDQLLCSDVQT